MIDNRLSIIGYQSPKCFKRLSRNYANHFVEEGFAAGGEYEHEQAG